MKETLGAILALLTEFKKDTKAASILIMFGLLIGCLYVVWLQAEDKNNIMNECSVELKSCQNERIKEVKDNQLKFERLALTIDSLNRLKRAKK